MGKPNIDRLRILRRAASEFAQSYASMGETAYRPLASRDLRECLQTLGIQRGDSILLHSAIGRLLRGGKETAPRDFDVSTYANSIIDMLMELVGPAGSIVMPTAPPVPNYEMAMRGLVFDPRKDGVGTGLLPDLFRKRPDTTRTLYPCQNVTVWGHHTRALISEQLAATPYPGGLSFNVRYAIHKIGGCQTNPYRRKEPDLFRRWNNGRDGESHDDQGDNNPQVRIDKK
jgi:hypothetical protein